MILSVSAWIFAVIPTGFAESFTNWPTAGEMDEIVRLGTECVLGVNERCWATQYQINPVRYRVAPFTNTTEFYLDKNLVGAMASKIRSLVPYYVNPDTVYNGTTNIVMLTATGLWVQLQIGNYGPHIVTNLGIVSTNFGADFTATPAIGANAATYGDNPWRIYITGLRERYKVLNALKMTDSGYTSYSTNNQSRYAEATNYSALVSAFNATPWSSINLGVGAYLDKDNAPPMSMMRAKGKFVVTMLQQTNFSANSYQVFLHLTKRAENPPINHFYDDGYGANEHYHLDNTLPGNYVFPYITAYYGDIQGALVAHYPLTSFFIESWMVEKLSVITDWQFNYCTVPLE